MRDPLDDICPQREKQREDDGERRGAFADYSVNKLRGETISWRRVHNHLPFQWWRMTAGSMAPFTPRQNSRCPRV
jgi:hypothetical protein